MYEDLGPAEHVSYDENGQLPAWQSAHATRTEVS